MLTRFMRKSFREAWPRQTQRVEATQSSLYPEVDPVVATEIRTVAGDPIDMTDDKSPEFEKRWAAWQRKGRLHDQRTKRRMRFALLGLGALFAATMLYSWVLK